MASLCFFLNIKYNTMLMAEIERKLQAVQEKIAEESEKERLIINCKKMKCKIVSKRDSSR